MRALYTLPRLQSVRLLYVAKRRRERRRERIARAVYCTLAAAAPAVLFIIATRGR